MGKQIACLLLLTGGVGCSAGASHTAESSDTLSRGSWLAASDEAAASLGIVGDSVSAVVKASGSTTVGMTAGTANGGESAPGDPSRRAPART